MRVALLFMWAVVVAVLLCQQPAHADTVPREAARYRLTLKREAHLAFGLEAPVAEFAAQVHQESRWAPHASSGVGAQGMAQFMPSTAAWWCKTQHMAAADCTPTNPTWALRALVGYDRWLFDRTQASSACEHLAFMLSAYNGGLGWVYRDQALASGSGLDKQVWFGSVERVNAGRTAAAWRENRAYPRVILFKHTPLYTAAGWGQGACV